MDRILISLGLGLGLASCSAARIDNPPPGVVCESIARSVITAPGAFEFISDASSRCRPAAAPAELQAPAAAEPAPP